MRERERERKRERERERVSKAVEEDSSEDRDRRQEKERKCHGFTKLLRHVCSMVEQEPLKLSGSRVELRAIHQGNLPIPSLDSSSDLFESIKN
jgi:hypothetical protein